MNLITIDDARAELNNDVLTDLEILELIDEASSIILDYLKYPAPAAWAEIDPVRKLPAVPGVVRAATRKVLGALAEAGGSDCNPISPGVENLLRRLRDPACQ